MVSEPTLFRTQKTLDFYVTPLFSKQGRHHICAACIAVFSCYSSKIYKNQLLIVPKSTKIIF